VERKIFQQLKTLNKLLKEIALPQETDKENPYLLNIVHTFSNRENRERKTSEKKWKTNTRRPLLK
jgi:hypothetical protein